MGRKAARAPSEASEDYDDPPPRKGKKPPPSELSEVEEDEEEETPRKSKSKGKGKRPPTPDEEDEEEEEDDEEDEGDEDDEDDDDEARALRKAAAHGRSHPDVWTCVPQEKLSLPQKYERFMESLSPGMKMIYTCAPAPCVRWAAARWLTCPAPVFAQHGVRCVHAYHHHRLRRPRLLRTGAQAGACPALRRSCGAFASGIERVLTAPRFRARGIPQALQLNTNYMVRMPCAAAAMRAWR